jgi:nicotinamidase/pyrazinamidase
MDYGPADALVVVDVQNDFADPAGSLFVAGGDEVVEVVNAELERAVDGGATVVFTQDWHPETTPHFTKDGGTWPVHCVGGTWGAELHPGVRVPEGALRLRKGTGGEDGYSGFTVADPVSGATSSTGLDEMLRQRGVTRVVVLGLATDHCVRATGLDAARLGYRTTVLRHGVRAVDLEPGAGDAALREMAAAGVLVE